MYVKTRSGEVILRLLNGFVSNVGFCHIFCMTKQTVKWGLKFSFFLHSSSALPALAREKRNLLTTEPPRYLSSIAFSTSSSIFLNCQGHLTLYKNGRRSKRLSSGE